ncbi:MAG: hypothetical protein FJW26_15115 [Acidimicrobiia bacterium]|nr:hypothetical protein [Acidimicrobiia bacterium]
MRTRTWPVLTAAFGTFLLLIGLFVFGTLRRGREINAEQDSAHEAYQRTEQLLNEVQADFYLSYVLARDLALDLSSQAALQRRQLSEIRAEMTGYLAEAERGGTPGAATVVKRLREEMDTYWRALRPMLEEPSSAGVSVDATFLRDQVLPRRNSIIQLAREIREFNQASFRREGEKVHQSQQEFFRYLVTLSTFALGLGLLVAVLGIYRISQLEARADEHQLQAERTGGGAAAIVAGIGQGPGRRTTRYFA